VIHLPCISNYTDFEPLEAEPDVAVHYLSDPATAPRFDVLIIPGTKSTVADLKWLRRAGWENFLVRHRRAGGWIVGICGGYQMLGRRIVDTDRIESDTTETIGLGLLEIETTFQSDKITDRIRAIHLPTGLPVAGYEIHCGRVTGVTESRAVFRLIHRDTRAVNEFEGVRSEDGRVIGTSIHGVFDSADFRRNFLDEVRASKGLGRLETNESGEAEANHIAAFDRIADALERCADFSKIAALAGISLSSAIL
jgi:adenosylcobyric acid synthase